MSDNVSGTSIDNPDAPLFDVVFYGNILDGFSVEQVKASFAKLFKLSNDKVEQIFSSSRVVLKANVTEAVASRFEAALREAGADVTLENLSAQLTLDSIEEPKAESGMASKAVETTDRHESVEPAPASDAEDETSYSADNSAADVDDAEVRTVPFEFSGNGFEYFKIWIVNIVLTVLTLGIYSAWAKVRNKQYFHGNTTLDGGSFAYLASPITILKGRLIAVACFIVYGVVSETLPLVGIALALALVLILPWLVLRTMAFNARNTAYRNICFNFKGNIKEAAIVFLGLPLLAIGPVLAVVGAMAAMQEQAQEMTVIMGVVAALSGLWAAAFFPYMMFKQKQFLVRGHAFGVSSFEFQAVPKDFYRIMLILLGAGFIYSITMVIPIIGVMFMVALPVVYLYGIAFYQVSMNNLLFDNTELESHSFQGRWEIHSYAWLFFINTLLTVLTLGIFIPWAKVRTARYAANHTDFIAVGSTQNFVAEQQEKVSAVGEELAGVFDFDFGL